jgi:hypothetical protein
MKLMRTWKAEEVMFGKGFIPVVAAFFAGTVEEVERFCSLKDSGKRVHIIIDPAGWVTVNGEAAYSSEQT